MNNYVLLIQCSDSKGIAYKVTGFIYHYGGNILELEQFVDTECNKFFMRVVWDNNKLIDLKEFDKSFYFVAVQFGITYSIYKKDKKQRLALFTSKSLHCLSEILLQWYIGNLHVDIPVIISNSSSAESLARKFDIPFEHFSFKSDDRLGIEQDQLKKLQEYNIDFIGLARYMRILSEDFIKEYRNKIINIHHSFLPAFIGMNPYKQAYERGVKIIGATSHFVVPELDAGPIITQDIKHVHHRHSVSNLREVGQETEKKVFYTALKKYADYKTLIYGNRTIVFE